MYADKIKSNMSAAIRRTLKEEMLEDESIFLLGEDICDPYGGIHKVTKGLTNTFGNDRIINSPVSEIAIVGAGVGAAIAGMRPIVEIMYADFFPICMDQIVNHAAKIFFQSGGRTPVPLVIRANYGSGTGEGSQHSQCPIGWLKNVPGIKIVVPSSPRDAQGLLKSSICDDNPVIFLEHKSLYNMTGEIEVENTSIPLGVAEVKREGTDVTVVACSLMLQYSLKAAEELVEEGISVEVVDPRTVKPLDTAMITASVKKTGRLITVDEGCFSGSLGADIVDVVVREAFSSLKTAPARLANDDVPLIASVKGEKLQLPDVEKIKTQIRNLIK